MNKTLMNQLYEGAKVVERNIGIPALFQIAQCIEESGWDLTPIPNSFNIFGIKWHYGEWVESWTKEWNDKTKKYDDVLAKFQKYKSFSECFLDHATLLTKDIGNPSYADALIQFKKDKDLETYVKAVSKIYATSPIYSISVLDIMDSLHKIFAVDVASTYTLELANAKNWAIRNKLINNWEDPIDNERLAVILYRLFNLKV